MINFSFIVYLSLSGRSYFSENAHASETYSWLSTIFYALGVFKVSVFESFSTVILLLLIFLEKICMIHERR